MEISPDLAKLAVPVSTLRHEPRNARTHDERNLLALMSSLREFGQQKPLVALADGTVIAGNGTLAAAIRLGWSKVAVVRFKDAEKARAFAIADNRTAELSAWDDDILAGVLSELRAGEVSLESVGFTDLELDRLLEEDIAVDPNGEWNGMPEFDQGDKTAVRHITVNFKTLEDATAFGELIGQPLTDRTRSIWYPKAEIERLMDKRYAVEEPAPEGK